jgi:hypothetical protein
MISTVDKPQTRKSKATLHNYSHIEEDTGQREQGTHHNYIYNVTNLSCLLLLLHT